MNSQIPYFFLSAHEPMSWTLKFSIVDILEDGISVILNWSGSSLSFIHKTFFSFVILKEFIEKTENEIFLEKKYPFVISLTNEKKSLALEFILLSDEDEFLSISITLDHQSNDMNSKFIENPKKKSIHPFKSQMPRYLIRFLKPDTKLSSLSEFIIKSLYERGIDLFRTH